MKVGAPNWDPYAQPREAPVHSVTLDPFFLSKYEMTQGQWWRVTHRNPSYHGPRNHSSGSVCSAEKSHALLHPVENVSWNECDEVLRRLGLLLPTEAQWEYGARGKTTTIWWTGNEEESLAGAANLADLRVVTVGDRAVGRAHDAWLDDGYPTHAPVGRLRTGGGIYMGATCGLRPFRAIDPPARGR